ncbi:Plasmodium exported protein, unknown function [Plasmodium sp. DRC-Itaito]|nr:Plasmodium exported protein, unknown function [Plasmodium sp. DRC-Itaito]
MAKHSQKNLVISFNNKIQCTMKSSSQNVNKSDSKEKLKRCTYFYKVLLCSIFIWICQCFYNNSYYMYKKDGIRYKGKKILGIRINKSLAEMDHRKYHPEYDYDSQENYESYYGVNQYSDESESYKSEDDESEEEYYNNTPRVTVMEPHTENSEVEDNYEKTIVDELNELPNDKKSLILSYIRNGNDNNMQLLPHPNNKQNNQENVSPNRDFFRHFMDFVKGYKLFDSPVLNALLPFLFIAFVYCTITMLVGNVRYIIALYILAKILKMHYDYKHKDNNNNNNNSNNNNNNNNNSNNNNNNNNNNNKSKRKN